MKKKIISLLLAAAMTCGTLAGCGGAGASDSGADASSDEASAADDNTSAQEEVTEESSGEEQAAEDGEVTVVKWFASRPVDGEIDLTMREIAQKYSEEHGGTWKLEVETTADRPSYLQKLRTLIAGNNMPDIIDIDADPYCKELVDAGMLVDVKAFLQEENMYDKFYPIALKYQEFTDGTMYTLPLEYHVEMIWYNKQIFEENNVEVPRTIDE